MSTTTNPKVYIAGPMTGYKNYNFFAFDKAKSDLQSQGWNVISPADIDRAHGFDPTIKGMSHDLSASDLGAMLARDIMAISDCDAIYMLDGWEPSKGANIEYLFAHIIGIDILYESD